MSEFAQRVYRTVFFAAGVYNLAFGFWAALFPRQFFEIFRLPDPRYPSIWSCLGMVVGLYGLIYLWGSRHLEIARPLIAIGLAGKILGPVGWVLTVGSGELPVRTFPLIVFNDLIWWMPFAMFLLEGRPLARQIKRASPYLCAAIHALAAVATLFLIRGGSEAVADVTERIRYFGQYADRWRIGWLLWMGAAVALIGFYVWWASRISRTRQAAGGSRRGISSIAATALLLAGAGLVCDFAGESILIGWIPEYYRPMNRIAALLSAGAGNGLYSLAGALLTMASPFRRWESVWAWLVWISGFALALFTLVEFAPGVIFSSAALMTLFIPWLVVVGARVR